MKGMSMSPWTVYWVMQADSICFAVSLLAAGFGFLAAFAGFWWMVATSESKPPTDFLDRMAARFVWFLNVALMLLFILAFCPSTKTLCAVIAVPAIANNERLQADAADIYKLGMERLKEELGGNVTAESEPTP